MRNLNTIYALSSGYGKCGVAVIRISGKSAGNALKIMTNMNELPKPRFALLKNLYHPINKDILDKGLVLWFPEPKSFTGEDCCEFQIHGGLAVISSVLNALQNISNLRPAEPGEFTRRAFIGGKLDLTEVEGLSGLLQAETEMQRKQAFIQTNGALRNLYNNWRTILMKCVANIETHIDFEESESLEGNLLKETVLPIENLYNDIQKHLTNGRKGEILRNGIKTIIIGEPNVGKSSLLNILCEKPAAIVTPIAGTTRDLLEVTLDINGYPLILTDTAGLRKSTSDIIEQEGIKKALDSIETSNLIILVVDVSNYIKWKLNNNKNFHEYLKEYITNMGIKNINLDDVQSETRKYLIVLNKMDLIEKENLINFTEISDYIQKFVFISCTNKNGLSNLIDKLTKRLKELCGTPSKEHPCMNKDRHRFLLNTCSKNLEHFLEIVNNEEKDVVIMAQYLRSALREIGKLTGNVTTEDLLDIIFKDFCIGK